MQNGHICKHGRWWVLRYRVGGRRVVDRLHLIDEHHKTAKSVELEARAILDPLNATAAPESVDSVGEFLSQIYLPFCQETYKPSTARSCRDMFALVRPHTTFCRMELRKVTTMNVRELLVAISKEKPRSQSTMRNVRNFLSMAFKYALNKGRVSADPVHRVITPKGAPAKETHAYTLPEIHAILDVLGEPAKTCVLVAALTGLRRSELQGLMWTDFVGNELRVSRAVWNGIEGETKTASSKAVVPLLPIVQRALEAHKARNGFNCWVFHGATGEPIRLDNLAKRDIRPALKRAGITWHGFHAFRRGLATNLCALGVDSRLAQTILRHSDLRTTLEHYIKPDVAAAKRAMDGLGAAFERAGKALGKRKLA